MQPVFFDPITEAALRIHDCVYIGQIWFDIIDWCLIHTINSPDMQNRAERLMQFHRKELYHRQSDGIRPKGTSGCKHSHSRLSPKSWRFHRRRPVLSLCFGKLPQKPQMRKLFDPAKCLDLSIFFFHHDRPRQFRYEAALSWKTKFGREIGIYFCDHFHLTVLLSAVSRTPLRSALTQQTDRSGCPSGTLYSDIPPE